MRLDKFLKVSRIIKRRTVAKEICEQGNISLGDRVAKAGTEVKPGDLLTIRFGNRTMRVKILKTPEVVRVQEAPETYEILNDSSVDE